MPFNMIAGALESHFCAIAIPGGQGPPAQMQMPAHAAVQYMQGNPASAVHQNLPYPAIFHVFFGDMSFFGDIIFLRRHVFVQRGIRETNGRGEARR
jgi:hypothetical protein